jgi:hypothetical protein
MADEKELDRRGEALLAELQKINKGPPKKKAPKWVHDVIDWIWNHLFG